MSQRFQQLTFTEQVAPLRGRVKADKWDLQAWSEIGKVLSSFADRPETLEEQREVYEDLLAQFPTCGQYWRQYAELCMAAEAPQADVKNIFSRSLLTCHYLDLWRSYLRFIKTVGHADTDGQINAGRGNEGMLEMRQAFEFTLDCVGQDIRAGEVWQEYLAFLSSPAPSTAGYTALWGEARPGQEGAERLRVLRAAYQRALAVPTTAIEALWKSYEQLELSGSSRAFARRVLDEQRPKFAAARSALLTRQRLLEKVDLTAFAGPPDCMPQELVDAWLKYLAWELGNSQKLEGPGHAARVSLAYEQALLVLMHFPEVWLDCVSWHLRQDPPDVETAQAMLDKGRQRLVGCLLLHCAAADIEEQQGRTDAARQVYEDLLRGRLPPTAAEEEAGEIAEPPTVQLSPEQATLAWLQLMGLVRRIDSVKGARQVFLRAIKDAECGWQVYAAAALMEWRNDRSNEGPPNRIFELGAKKDFLGEPNFVLAYIDFQLGLGDIANARATFERALTVTPAQQQDRLWDAYVQLEYQNGGPGAVHAIEVRRCEALAAQGSSTVATVRLALLKYRAMDLWPVAEAEKRHLQRLLGEGPPAQAAAAPAAAAAKPAAAAPLAAGKAERGPVAAAAPGPADATGTNGIPSRQERPRPTKWSDGPPGGGAPAAVQPRPSFRPPPAPRPAGPAGQRLPRMPPELTEFLRDMPPARVLSGPEPDVDQVMDIITHFDLSPAGIAAADAAYGPPPPQPGALQPAHQQPAVMPGPGPYAGHSHGPATGVYGPGQGPAMEPRYDAQDLRGHKRKFEGPPGPGYGGSPHMDVGPVHDVFQKRRIQRAKMTPPDN